MFDNYTDRKSKGLVTLGTSGLSYVDAVWNEKRFDPTTGEESEPMQQQISLDDVKSQRDSLSSQLDNLNTLIEDIEALSS